MTQQQTRQHHRTQPIEVSGPDPFEGGGGLQEQAAAFAQVAREARRECDQGADAESTLHARRNRSGQ
jgi:hypothetical protein